MLRQLFQAEHMGAQEKYCPCAHDMEKIGCLLSNA